MTVFHQIAANGNESHFAAPSGNGAASELSADRIIMINASGGPQGKIDEQLRGLGYEVAYLPEDSDALDKLEPMAETRRAVVLDWRSDKTKDSAFAEELASKATDAGLPVLTLAAAERPADIQTASEAGLSTIVSMPCRLADVKNALDKLARRVRAAHSEPATGLEDVADLLESCKFHFRSPADVDRLVPVIARFFPDPARSATGLTELMMNAIEHGNLEIGHDRKAEWVARGIYGSELEKRLQTLPYAERRAELTINRRSDGIMIVITDEGCGFCWQDVIRAGAASPADPLSETVGDGLARAKQESFDELRFNAVGNQVTAFVANRRHV